jgi:hypothetical protein
MIATYNNFLKQISDVRDLGVVYSNNIIQSPLLSDLLSDILRFQLVYAVSAFDRFIHEIVRIGMRKTIENSEQLTEKAKSFQISLDSVLDIYQRNPLPPMSKQDYLILKIEEKIKEKHSELSFQKPEKISEALSHIWDEQHKWQQIVKNMRILLSGTTNTEKEKNLKQRVILIVERRNQIVHEADIDFVTGKKRNIDKANIDENVNIIEDLGTSIYRCIR